MDLQAMQGTLERALSGDQAALWDLVDLFTPVIQKRVARVLLSRRQGASSGRDIHQEVDDLAQEVFVTLFADDGRVLRTWSPERGLSLLNFVGLVAERRAGGILRSGKRSPWRDDPTLIEDLDEADDDGGPEAATASREMLRLLLDRLKEELSPYGRQMFDLLFLQELPPDEVARKTGKTLAAIYKWHSRLRQLACRILDELSNPDGALQRP
jgi:RNA polymerase sigma-70 factor (ECF subfamily)